MIDSWRAGARSTSRDGAGGGHALGQRRGEALGEGGGVDGSVSSTSRYSASLSWPTDRASPKLTLGRGEKPSVNASGQLLDAEGSLERAGDVAVRR